MSDEQVDKLQAALVEAERATAVTAERFVEPRRGILAEAAARRHQFVFGRRGVGKSTLLLKIKRERPSAEVIFVDIEALRGRPYPDVLIELLIDLFGKLEARLRTRVRLFAGPRRTLNEVRELTGDLRTLLSDPQVATRTFHERRSRHRGASGSLGLRLNLLSHSGVTAAARAEAESGHEQGREATFDESKMDGLFVVAVRIRAVLQQVQKALGEEPTLIVLDDFHHIPPVDQPPVLAYLHQVVKNLGIYLKICGVRHRIRPFVEGSPPVGMQLEQDADSISLDITLAEFALAKCFLEKVLEGICYPLSIDLETLITEGGRTRLVLGSGGVARDYLTLARAALRKATERAATISRPHNRITAEDVNEAAATFTTTRQEDLANDAAEDADRIRQQLRDLVSFCINGPETNMFLVESINLREKDWGRDIQALADLRFVHEIGTTTIRANDYSAENEFRGRLFTGFTLGLSNYTGTRSKRYLEQIEFWTASGKERARAERLIYPPRRSSTLAIEALKENKANSPHGYVQVPSLFELLEQVPSKSA